MKGVLEKQRFEPPDQVIEYSKIEVDEELYNKLENRAKEEGISVSLLTQRLLDKAHSKA